MTAEVRPRALELQPDQLPEEVKSGRRFVVWRWEWNSTAEKWDKPPRQLDGRMASSTDPETWVTFDEALSAYRTGRFDGVGIVLSLQTDLVGVDLDHCVDPETGEIGKAARSIVQGLDTYTELSPSGTGLRLLARGSLPPGGRVKNPDDRLPFKVEVYDASRYVTLTGHSLGGSFEDRTEALARMHRWLFRINGKAKERPTPEPSGPEPSAGLETDEQLLEAARQASNGAEFRLLYDHGDLSSHSGDASAADADLVCRLVWWSEHDVVRVDRLFRRSALMRGKWDERHYADGRTYGAGTIDSALQKVQRRVSGDTWRVGSRTYSSPNGQHHRSESVVPQSQAEEIEQLQENRPLPTLPLECLPAPLANLADHLAGIWNVDPALYAVPGLAVLSAAIGNTAWLQLPGGAIAPAVLWLGIVARTGSGKTPAAELVSAPLLNVQRELDGEYMLKLESWKRLSKAEKETTPRPEPRQVTVTDSTWEAAVVSLHHNPGGMLWTRDEIAGIFKQLDAYHSRGSDFAAEDLLSTWSQQPIRRKRIKDAEYTVVPQPFLAIYGGLQPARAAELGNNEAGRLSRLLCYQTNRWPAPSDADPDPRILKTWNELVSELVAGRLWGGRNRMLHLSAEARQLWTERQNQRAAEMRDTDEETADYLAKLDQHAGRIIVISHVCRYLEDDRCPVEADTVEAGWQVARVFLEHQLATFRPTVSDFVVRPEERAEVHAVMRLDRWVHDQGGRGRRREAQRRMVGGARNPADLDRLVNRWLAMKLGHLETVKSDRGSPSIWLVRGPE